MFISRHIRVRLLLCAAGLQGSEETQNVVASMQIRAATKDYFSNPLQTKYLACLSSFLTKM